MTTEKFCCLEMGSVCEWGGRQNSECPDCNQVPRFLHEFSDIANLHYSQFGWSDCIVTSHKALSCVIKAGSTFGTIHSLIPLACNYARDYRLDKISCGHNFHESYLLSRVDSTSMTFLRFGFGVLGLVCCKQVHFAKLILYNTNFRNKIVTLGTVCPFRDLPGSATNSVRSSSSTLVLGTCALTTPRLTSFCRVK